MIDAISKDGGEEQAGIGRGNIIFYMRKIYNPFKWNTPIRHLKLMNPNLFIKP